MNKLKDILRQVLSQRLINIFYHLPKAMLANIFYLFPTRGLTVIGVTGTDGKTTTVNMIYQILKDAGKKVSMVSTINAVIGGKVSDTGFHVTSPDPFSVQKFARQAEQHGDEYLVLEVTSHALDQYRFWGVKFDVAVLTNITHEHLDYHKTQENYLNTKLKILKNVKYAVINHNLKPFIHSYIGVYNLITFGLTRGDCNQKQIKLKLKIPGNYNTENALAAMATALTLDIPKEIVKKAVENFKGIAGRMEEVKNNKGIKIIIDFAHTPNALEKALETLRVQTKGKLIAVFGCAGKRDVRKRFLMGEIAQKLADLVVITAEDPRGELKIINQQIKNGAEKIGGKFNKDFYIIDDREKAIDFAINKLAKRGDIVGIFGKGHEKGMNLDGKREIPWSEREAVKKILSNG